MQVSRFARPWICQADILHAVIILLQPFAVHSEVRKKRIIAIEKDELQLPPGPYVLLRATGQIFPVSRVFKDSHQAFTSGIFRKSALSSKWHECHVDLSNHTG
jgi:hypothetical protein